MSNNIPNMEGQTRFLKNTLTQQVFLWNKNLVDHDDIMVEVTAEVAIALMAQQGIPTDNLITLINAERALQAAQLEMQRNNAAAMQTLQTQHPQYAQPQNYAPQNGLVPQQPMGLNPAPVPQDAYAPAPQGGYIASGTEHPPLSQYAPIAQPPLTQSPTGMLPPQQTPMMGAPAMLNPVPGAAVPLTAEELARQPLSYPVGVAPPPYSNTLTIQDTGNTTHLGVALHPPQ